MLETFLKKISAELSTFIMFFFKKKLDLLINIINLEDFVYLNKALVNVHNFLLMKKKKKKKKK